MASSVKLGVVLDDFVDQLVEKGRYGSRSEVMREGVRLVQERERWFSMVQSAIDEGLADVDAGRVRPIDEVFDELEERFRPR